MVRSIGAVGIGLVCCVGCCGSLLEGLLTPKDIDVEVHQPDPLEVGEPGQLVFTVHNRSESPHVLGEVHLPDDIGDRLTVHGTRPAFVGRRPHPLFPDQQRNKGFVFDQAVPPGGSVTLTFRVEVAEAVTPMGMIEVCFDPHLLETEQDYYDNSLPLCRTPWHTVEVKGAPDRNLLDDEPPPKKKPARRPRRER